MKFHKIALLASISILPMQQSFAVSANQAGLAQPNRTKATMVMRAKKIIKPNKVISGNKPIGTVAGPGAEYTQNALVVGDNVIAKTGVNLKLLSLGWDDEICVNACPQLTRIGLDYPTCDLAFRVTNTGDVASGNFNVNLLRTTVGGNIVPLQINASGVFRLAPHETKTFKIGPDSVGLYKTGRPFTLTLDHLNQIAETNEGDNTAIFLPPQ